MDIADNSQLESKARIGLMVGSILAAMMALIDATAVNVSLPNIQGGLSGTPDTVSWVIIIYTLGASIVTPMADAICRSFGTKRVFTVSIILFGITSVLCGFAQSLTMLIIIRGIQGLAGGFLAPLAEAILLSLWGQENRMKGMAIYGICLMIGPVLGPILGGIITADLDWPWVFYLNVPICIIRYLSRDNTKTVPVDVTGAFLIALFIISLEVILSRGNHYNWWSSMTIDILTAICVISGITFLLRGFGKKNHIVPFYIFKNKEFSFAAIALTIFGMPLVATMVIFPLFMQMIFNYPADLIGYLMAPRGLATALTFIIIRKFDYLLHDYLKILIALCLIWFSNSDLAHIGMSVSQGHLVWIMVLQGLGTGLFMMPILKISVSTIEQSSYGLLSSMTNFFRSLGTSIGIAVAIYIYQSSSQRSWYHLSGHVYESNPAYLSLMRHWQNMGLSLSQQHAMLAQTVNQQANLIGFNNAFLGIGFTAVIIGGFIVVMKWQDLIGFIFNRKL